MPVSVDIVLPCYNPNDTWPDELLSFDASVKEICSCRYIVVNDGSPGNKVFEQVAFLQEKNIPVRLISYEKNRGKGYALRQGVSVADAEFIVYTDIDFPFTNKSTADLVQELITGSVDVVAGYRDRSYYQKKMSGFRKLLSKAFRFFIKDVLNMKLSDTQCGLKGFNKKGREKFLQTRIDRYLFDFEFIYLCGKDSALSMKPQPVRLKDSVVFSKMKLKVLIQESMNLLSVLLFRRTSPGS